LVSYSTGTGAFGRG